MPTIQDIAHEAKVSATAVSMALNGRRGISATTRSRVEAVARKLNYRLRGAGRPLKSVKVKTIAIVYGGFSRWGGQLNPLTRDWTRGVREGFSGSGADVLITGGVGSVDEDGVLLDAVNAGEVDGAIVIAAKPDDGYLRYLVEHHVPTVAMSRRAEFNEFSTVNLDNYGSARQVVNYFVEQGHRRIGLFAGLDRYSYSRERTAGFLDAMREHGLEPTVVETLDVYDPNPPVVPACRHAVDAGATAVFVSSSDELAARCIDAWLGMGVRIPQDLSVIGYNDVGLTTPAGGLSSVGHDKVRMGRTAAELLMELVADRDHVRMRSLTVATHLVPRDTTGPAPDTGLST